MPQNRRPELFFYMDDSGSKDLDRRPKDDNDKTPDWFALGGILLKANDKEFIEESMLKFRERWPQLNGSPLRSYNIRNQSGNFRWLSELSSQDRNQFYTELGEMICGLPVIISACVIHRPGYNARYKEKYQGQRWQLSKSAFTISVERSAKWAISQNSRLRVFVERSDRKTESLLKSYYEEMRSEGLPFDAKNSAKYQPMAAAMLRETLFEFRVKTKESHLMQLADLALWPTCHGGYDTAHKPFQMLSQSGRLLDAHCTPENGLQGIKYFCFPTA